jgi:hypothetical protein
VEFEKRAIGFVWTDEGSQLVEQAEEVRARDERAGVDRAGDTSWRSWQRLRRPARRGCRERS